MIPREEIESWVKEALFCTDKEYQLVEVVRTAIEVAALQCAKLAEAHAIPWHNVQAQACFAIAKDIRDAIGYKLVDGPMPTQEDAKDSQK